MFVKLIFLIILQPVELQVGERLPCQGGLQGRAAALQLLRREVGRKVVDQPDALRVWRGGLAADAGEFRVDSGLNAHWLLG